MESIDEELQKIAVKVDKGRSPKITPRKLLSMFDAKRRGVYVVAEIRSRLARHKLKTEPDFAEVDMDAPVKIIYIGERPRYIDRLQEAYELAQSGEPRTLSVREFLRWFAFERRGTQVCEQVRAHLESFELKTEPDFENVHIDAEINLCLASEPSPPRPAETEAQAIQPPLESAAVPVGPQVEVKDRTFKVGTLAEADREVVCVKPQSSLREATSYMATKQISHLPVMRNEREALGILRWKDVGNYLLMSSIGTLDDPVERAMTTPKEVPADASFLRVIPEILQHGCVLVRGAQRRITGIITKKDLGRLLHDKARPFVVLGEIENGLRSLIERGDFTSEELRTLALHPDSKRKVESVADLTLGEYQRLLEQDQGWARINIGLDKKAFIGQLDRVRLVRNSVMHFDPEGTSESEQKTLRGFLDTLDDLRRLSS